MKQSRATAKAGPRKPRWRWLLLAGVVVWAAIGTYRALHKPPLVTALNGTRAHYFLTPDNDLIPHLSGAQGRLCDSFAVFDSSIFLVVGSHLLELRRQPGKGWDAELEPRLLSDQLGDINQFTVDAGGVILITKAKKLFQLTGAGTLEEVANLPVGCMRIAASREPGFAYLFGDDMDLEKNVFLLSDLDGSATLLASFNSTPRALAEAVDGIYVGTMDNNIFQVLGANKRLVIALPFMPSPLGDDAQKTLPGVLRALACTDDGRLLFFSTYNTVYALFGDTAVPITKDLGGAIHWRDGVLFVMDANRNFLVGIEGIPAALGLSGGG